MAARGRRISYVAALAAALFAASCGEDSAVEPGPDAAPGTDAGRDQFTPAEDSSADAPLSYECEPIPLPTECPTPAPTFAHDVAPIIGQRCSGPCHFGAPRGPWALTDYGHVADWKDDVQALVHNCTMPPQDAGVPITTAERETILNWIRCGLPR
jgi:hypothetical protein